MSYPSLTPEAQKYLTDLRSGWKLHLYYLKNLPSAFWWGIRICSANETKAQVKICYNWRTRNPFRSIYFAALCGAGELATGVLANLARIGRGNISLLVLEQKAEFLKKATSTVVFTCEEGQKAFEAVRLAIETRTPQTATLMATGRNENQELVSRIYITWTFKLRENKNT